ncbi:MAG: hypothetical protein SOW78_10085 [Clostridia bacterium]|nr:hypothetical protein [Clostridia bacterium]
MMKKYIVFLIAVIVIGFVAYGVLESLPPSKNEVEGMIYKQAAIVLSYENSSNPLITALVNNAYIDVEKVDKSSGGYIASCKIGNHNFKSAYDKCISNEYTSTLNQFTSDFIDILNQEEMIYSTIQINVIKNSAGKYQAELTERDIDVLTGGFITFSASYFETNE